MPDTLALAASPAVRTAREQIADHLREDICCGRLAEGERLSEVALAERFGVGRGPVREALLQLTHEGLLRAKPNCGATVAPAAPTAVRDLVMPIRRTLETYALRQVFDRLADADFRDWDAQVARIEAAARVEDLAGLFRADMAFHRSLLAKPGQPELLALWHVIVGRVQMYFWQVVKQYDGRLTAIADDHRELLDTFRAGDLEAAVAALDRHIW